MPAHHGKSGTSAGVAQGQSSTSGGQGRQDPEGGKSVPPSAPISVPVPAHISGGGGGDRNQPSGGSFAGKGSGRTGPPGRNYNIGGLAGLWPR